MEDIVRSIEEIQQSQASVQSSGVKPGDYVFATKFIDAQPTDRWQVDSVHRVDGEAVYFKETGVIPYKFAQIITPGEGLKILKEWKSKYK